MSKNNLNLNETLNRNYTNNEFEGFCIDLLDEISRVLKFRYKIKPIRTGKYDDMVEEIKNKVIKIIQRKMTKYFCVFVFL